MSDFMSFTLWKQHEQQFTRELELKRTVEEELTARKRDREQALQSEVSREDSPISAHGENALPADLASEHDRELVAR